jgi:hypothetical protein
MTKYASSMSLRQQESRRITILQQMWQEHLSYGQAFELPGMRSFKSRSCSLLRQVRRGSRSGPCAWRAIRRTDIAREQRCLSQVREFPQSVHLGSNDVPYQDSVHVPTLRYSPNNDLLHSLSSGDRSPSLRTGISCILPGWAVFLLAHWQRRCRLEMTAPPTVETFARPSDIKEDSERGFTK